MGARFAARDEDCRTLRVCAPHRVAGRVDDSRSRNALPDRGHGLSGHAADSQDAEREEAFMKVYFIGAGPGAADLITIRGARILGRVDLVLYAGSLVPADLLQHCRPDAELIDTAGLDLEQQEAYYRSAQA